MKVSDCTRILSYLKRQNSPVVSQITGSNLQDFKDTNDVLVVGYFEHDDEKSRDAFTSLAMEMRDDFLFGVASDDTLAEQEGVKIPSIAVYTKFEKEKHVLELSDNHEPMRDFMKTYGRPLIIHFDPIVHSISFGVSTATPFRHHSLTLISSSDFRSSTSSSIPQNTKPTSQNWPNHSQNATEAE